MKKNVKKYILSFIFLAFMATTLLFFVNLNRIFYLLKNEYQLIEKTELSEAVKEYDIVLCEFGLNNQKYAFVSLQKYVYPERNIDSTTYNVDFYRLKRTGIFSLDWTLVYVGGTNTENIDFARLVEMVKQDCSQFENSKNDYDDEDINWSYTPFDAELFNSIETEFDSDTGPKDLNGDGLIDSNDIQLEIEERMKVDPIYRKNIESRIENPPEKYEIIR